MGFHLMCGLDEAVCSRQVKSTENLCFHPDLLYFWYNYLVSFFCLSLSGRFNFYRCCETLLEDLLKFLDGGYRLYSTRSFLAELVNNLSDRKWKYTSLSSMLRTHFIVLSVYWYFSCFQYFFKGFVECCDGLRPSPLLRAKPRQAGWHQRFPLEEQFCLSRLRSDSP